MGKTRNTGYLGNIVTYDASNNIVLPALLTVGVAPDSSDNSGKVPSTSWVRNYVTNLGYQSVLTLTTTGSSGAATFSSNILNIPNYTLSGLGGVPTSRTLTINGYAYDLSADRTWNVGTITGSGTANQVAFFNNSSNIISESNLYWDATNNKLGIGNSNPNGLNSGASNLVIGDGTAGNRGITIYTGTTSEGNIYFADTDSTYAGYIKYTHIDDTFTFATAGATNLALKYASAVGLTIGAIQAGATDTDKFLVIDAGVVKYRTGTQILSDIAAEPAVTAGTTSQYYRGDKTFQTLNTTAVAEGTNLYYTDARVGSYLTTNSYATQTYVNTQVSNLVNSAPATLDTLNELATALGNDPNFATTVATSIGTKQAQLNGTGFVKASGTTISYDNNTYLSTSGGTITSLTISTLSGAVYADATGALGTTSGTQDTIAYWGSSRSIASLSTATYPSLTELSYVKGVTSSIQTQLNSKLSSYTETDTLATVTGRGASTSTNLTFNGTLTMGTGGTQYIRMGRFPATTTNTGEAWIGRASDRGAGTMTVQLGSATGEVFEVVDYAWSRVVLKAGMNDFLYKDNTIWHAGNDGSGSGLDADLLDGIDSSGYSRVRSSALTLPTGTYNGWYRIATSSQAVGGYGGRGAFRVVIAQTGNNLGPAQVAINGYKDWGLGVFISSVEDYNGASSMTQFRVTSSGDYSYLEAFINWTAPSAQDYYVYTYDNGHNNNTWIPYNGNVVAGVASPAASYSMSRISNTANYAGLAIAGNSVLTTSNYSSYALPLTGGIMTGDIQMGNNQNRIIKFRTASAWDYSLRGVNDDFFITDNPGVNYVACYYNGGGSNKFISLMGQFSVYANGVSYFGNSVTITGQFYVNGNQNTANFRNTSSTSNTNVQMGNDETTNGGGMALFGSAFSSSGQYRASGAYFYSNRSGGLTIHAEGNNSMYLATNGTAAITINSSQQVTFNSRIFATATNGAIQFSGSGYTLNPSGMMIGQYVSGMGYIQAPSAGRVEIWNGATENVATFNNDRTTVFYGTPYPGGNGTINLGTSSNRWATVFTSDLDMSNGIGDYTIVEGYENLYLYNNNTKKVFKFNLTEVDPSEAPPKKIK